MPNSYLLKIALEDVPGPIWRRFVVPSDIALDTLHVVIQRVMGWQGGNRHIFIVGRKQFTYRVDVDKEFGDLPDDAYSLEDVLPKNGKFKYFYDISGAWMHHVVVENRNYSNTDYSQPIYCLEGSHACPPDNTYHYEYFLEIIGDPKHEEYEYLTKWYKEHYGVPFDPDRFEISEINQSLSKIMPSTIPVNRNANPSWSWDDDSDTDDSTDEGAEQDILSQQSVNLLEKALKEIAIQSPPQNKTTKKSSKKKPK